MASDTIKATVNTKKQVKTTASIIMYAILALFSLAMGFYDIASKRTLFGILFLAAAAIFLILLIIKSNSVFGTSLKYKDSSLYMKSYANNFLPYEIDGSFFSDLIPSKTKITKIPVSDISLIFIGTKDYIKRNMTESGKKFIRTVYPYEHSSKKSKRNMISSLDLIYVETTDNDCAFMCIEGYNPKAVVQILAQACENNPSISVKVNSRDYRRYIAELNSK